MPKKTTRRVPKRTAVVAARGLGDGLLAMILSHNLRLSGFETTTFSTILCELKRWFPHQNILPIPDTFPFEKYDQVIAADYSILSTTQHEKLILLKENDLDKSCTMVSNFARICRHRLGLPYALKENGLVPPETHVKRPLRVVIHPESADCRKNWPQEKFIALSAELEARGWEVIFCVSPQERERWQGHLPEEKLPFFQSVDSLASLLLTAQALIGNDSGVGHLASNLGIFTLSLFARKSYARLWRPGWGDGRVVTPPPLLPGARLRQKYWKQLLPVERVLSSFILNLSLIEKRRK